MARNEEISYDYALNWAKSTNNQTAVKQLERIGKPPYRDGLKGLMVQRKLLDKSGGGNTHKGSAGGILGKTALKCTEYTLPTMFRWLQGMTFSSTIILEQLMKVDFVSTVRELRVPTYILAGQYDYQTVIPLARQFYEQLQAPRKEFIVFADCAHCALFEKPHDFAEVLRRVKRETIG
jgi:pimeloyl-ACP methyl ester carboxylesterase